MASSSNGGGKVRTLRDVELAPRFFWKQTLEEQISCTIHDQNADYKKRTLTENEVAALALNEIAARYRGGFFFHLPSRPIWVRPTESEKLPVQRAPVMPGPRYPTLLFMWVRWGEDMYNKFVSDTHRSRYLMSDAISNPPPPETPLFAIQYAIHRCPAFHTPDSDSLVLYATRSAYYLVRTSVAAEILGVDKDGTKLGAANWLWDHAAMDKDRDDRHRKHASMSQYGLPSLEDVYHQIVQQCTTGELPATFAANELRSVLPRPDPVQAASVGSVLGERQNAEPPTRRGETRKFVPRKRRRRRINDDETIEESANA